MTTQKQRKSLLSIPVIRGSEYKILMDNETYILEKWDRFQNWDINLYNADEDRENYIITFGTLKECYEFLLTYK